MTRVDWKAIGLAKPSNGVGGEISPLDSEERDELHSGNVKCLSLSSLCKKDELRLNVAIY